VALTPLLCFCFFIYATVMKECNFKEKSEFFNYEVRSLSACERACVCMCARACACMKTLFFSVF
jgi:hypothetical protein